MSVNTRRRKEAKFDTYVVLGKERLRVVIAVDEDLRERVVQRRLLKSTRNLRLNPRKDQLEPIPLLHLLDEFLNREDPNDRRKKTLDRLLIAVHIEQSTNDLRRSRRVDTLDIHLDELDESVLVQVEHEIVDEVEAVADDDEWELIGELGFLEEVFDFLGVIEVALATDALDLADLSGASGGLDVLEVDFGVLAQVDDRAEVVVET